MKQIKRILVSMILVLIMSMTIPFLTPNNTYYVSAASVRLNITKETIYVGETLQLEILNTDKLVKWSTSDKEIAKVSSKGRITGLKKGLVKIVAQVGEKRYTCSIEVKNEELSAKEVYKLSVKSTVEINAEIAGEYVNIGSGFYVEEGVIVTNYHVIAGSNNIKVSTYDGTTYAVDSILGYDEDLDIALLQVNSKNDYLKRNQEGVTIGETIYVLGSPLGLTGTFTSGMVSASRNIDGIDYIQVSAPMSPGNSGGPLLNAYGEVMGINTWQYADGQNLNFSIHINEIDNVDTTNPVNVTEFSVLTEESIAYTKSLNEDLSLINSITGLIESTNVTVAKNYYMNKKLTKIGFYVGLITVSVDSQNIISDITHVIYK